MDDSTDHNQDLRFELVADAGDAAVEDPLQFVRRKLRGRYRLTILLAILLALCGSLIGYSTAPVRYESSGLIQFKPTLPTILYKSAENQPTPLFDSYVSAQAALIRSRQILEEALNDSELQDERWFEQPLTVDGLAGMIAVKHQRGEQMVSVTSTHREPVIAEMTVNAVLRSIDRNYHDPNRLSPTVREQKLVQREQQLQDELQELGEQILAESDQYGVATIKRLHAEQIQTLIALDHKIAELTRALSDLEARSPDNGAAINSAGLSALVGSMDLEDEEALVDLYEQERSVMADLERLTERFGPRHPSIRDLERRLVVVRERIAEEAQAITGNPDTNDGLMDVRSSLWAASTHRLRSRLAQLEAEREAMRVSATDLGTRSVTVDNLEDRQQMLKLRLQETRQALDVLRVEMNREESARISIASFGERPSVPSTDRRRAMAAASALFGCGLAGCLVVMVGFLDPRCRYAPELQQAIAPAQIICQIPDLSDNAEQTAELASLGVHQLRNLLEVQRGTDQHAVYTITSPHRQEGKTSLVLALGASFAVAGRRTLIVDADVTRAGLSDEIGMRNLGGLCEAIGTASGRQGEIHETDNENLWALPVGNVTAVDSRDLARDKLDSLLKAIRDRFDVILFDTGPVLTSLEASLVASISDQVILTVARHQHVEQVRASMERLRRVGATCAGVVFNRAPQSDFDCRDWQVTTGPTHAAHLLSKPAQHQQFMGPIGRIDRADDTDSPRMAA